jgi:hypothetical protein
MSGIERGVPNISILKLASLADVLGARPADLLPK